MSDTTIMREGVDAAISELERVFKANPSHFYTENDLVCTLHQLIKSQLSDLLLYRGQSLLHCEYPTPWRCDMANYKFQFEPDESRKHRGHFDLSIINPTFVDRCNADYQSIKGQNFKKFKNARDAHIGSGDTILTYAIELMFSRDPRARNCFSKSTIQDALKLRATRDEKKALSVARLLCFSCGNIFNDDQWKVAKQDDIISLIYA